MLKFTKPVSNTLSIVIVIDRSSSMQSHSKETVKSLNQQIQSFRDEAARTNIETDISIISFADFVVRDMVAIPAKDCRDIDPASYLANGNTALYDAIADGVNLLSSRGTSRKFMLVITDGEENQSKYQSNSSIRRIIEQQLADNTWSMAMCVPPNTKYTIAQSLGVPEKCITEWERTAVGIERNTQAIRTSNTMLFANYSAGHTCTRGYFQPDVNNLAPAVVQTNLNDLTGNFQVLPVQSKEPIASFVARTTNRPYRVGAAFYQLTKKETVQASKDIMIRDKQGKIYGGANARSLLRIPAGGNIELNPASNNDYEVYVKSTSHNRNLVPNTNVLVQK